MVPLQERTNTALAKAASKIGAEILFRYYKGDTAILDEAAAEFQKELMRRPWEGSMSDLLLLCKERNRQTMRSL